LRRDSLSVAISVLLSAVKMLLDNGCPTGASSCGFQNCLPGKEAERITPIDQEEPDMEGRRTRRFEDEPRTESLNRDERRPRRPVIDRERQRRE
jgi:hypothetical protein